MVGASPKQLLTLPIDRSLWAAVGRVCQIGARQEGNLIMAENLTWACCVSSIGPVCEHRRLPERPEFAACRERTDEEEQAVSDALKRRKRANVKR